MSFLKYVNTKQTVVALSAAVAVGLIAAAIYLKRKRQKSFPSTPDSPASTTVKNKTGKLEADSAISLSAPNNLKGQRHQHNQSISESHTASTTSSTASSTTSSSRRSRNVFASKSQDLVAVEKLYKEGVNSFEEAIEKWEKATDLLEVPFDIASSSSSGSTLAASSSSHIGLKGGTPELENGKTRYKAVGDLPLTELDNCGLPEAVLRHRRMSGEHSNSMGDLNELLKIGKAEKDFDPNEEFFNSRETLSPRNDGPPVVLLQERLQSIVKKAKRLQQTIDYVLYDETATDSDTDITLIGIGDDPDTDFISDDDSESTASYVSAREFWDTRSTDSCSKRLKLFEEALVAVEKGEVCCRTCRASLLNCFSEEEFLAKLHCVRQGFEVMLQDVTVRNWLKESGQSMIECLLCVAGQNIVEFQEAFTNMFAYVDCVENWTEIENELKGRKVVQTTFYDVVLDFLLMDAFDDLASPPGAVVSIMQNKWLADSLKESALYTAIWSVLKAKRSRLQYSNGFVSRMYDISTHVTPVLAWGFMGPEGKLKDTCEYFKKEVIEFLQGLFSFEHVRYTTPPQMADDILKLSKNRFGSLMNYLQNSIPAACR